ncbi:MAG: M48 family metalloprotease [Armatimonadetes bacterium]|nr:M48 family metalloprotease [Armatimonadota bacterium]
MRTHAAPMRTSRGAVAGVIVALLLVLLPAAPAHAQLISTDEEIRIGRQVAREVEAEYGVVHDPAQTAAIDAIGRRLAQFSDRPNLPYTFKILRVREANALSIPGGFIYVTAGMLRFARSEEELAFVLGHEVAHAARRHGAQLLERDFYFSIVIRVLFGQDMSAAQIASFARALVQRGYSREMEFDADQSGITYMRRAGYNPVAGLTFLDRLRVASGRDPSSFEVLFRTHPALSDRVARVRQQLREMGYPVARTPAEPQRATVPPQQSPAPTPAIAPSRSPGEVR